MAGNDIIRDPLAVGLQPAAVEIPEPAPQAAPVAPAPAPDVSAPAPLAPVAPAGADGPGPNALLPSAAPQPGPDFSSIAPAPARRGPDMSHLDAVDKQFGLVGRDEGADRAAALRLLNTRTEPDTLETVAEYFLSTVGGLSRSVATVAGLPIDIANIFSNLLAGESLIPGGSQQFMQASDELGERLLHSLGADPETLSRMEGAPGAETFGEGVEFFGVGGLLTKPMGAAARKFAGPVKEVVTVMEKAPLRHRIATGIQKSVAEMGAFEKAAPLKAAAIEGAISATSGLAGLLHRDERPGHPVERFFVELGVGVFTPLSVKTVKAVASMGPIAKTFSVVRRFFIGNEEQNKQRVAEFLQLATSTDPGGTKAAVANLAANAGQKVSPAVQAQSDALLDIQAAINADFRALGREGEKDLIAFGEATRQDFPNAAVPEGEVVAATELVKSYADAANLRVDHVMNTLRQKIASSVRVVDQQARKMGGDMTVVMANVRLYNRVRAASRVGRRYVDAMFKGLDMDVAIDPGPGTAGMKRAYQEFVDADIPSSILPPQIRLWLGQMKKVDGVTQFVPGKLAEAPTLGNANSIRRQIGEAIGREMGETAPNRNKVRVLTRLQQDLVKGFEGAAGGDDFNAAMKAHADYAEMFYKGHVSDLLGTADRVGNPTIDPRLAGSTVARSNVEGFVAASDIEDAVRSVSNVSAKERITNVVRATVYTKVTSTGPDGLRVVDKAKVLSYLDSKEAEDLMKMLPELRDEIAALATDQQVVNGYKKLYDTAVRTVDMDRRVVGATAMLREGVTDWPTLMRGGHVIQSVNRLMHRLKTAKYLNAVDRKKAVWGARHDYLRYLQDQATSGMPGAERVSGAALVRNLKAHRDITAAVFQGDPGAVERLEKVAQRFVTIENALGASPVSGGLKSLQIGDVMEELIFQLLGAKVGAKLGGGIGSALAGAGIGAQASKKFVRGLGSDDLRGLLINVMQNPADLALALKRPVTKVDQARVFKMLHTWAVRSGVQMGNDLMPEDDQGDRKTAARPEPMRPPPVNFVDAEGNPAQPHVTAKDGPAL